MIANSTPREALAAAARHVGGFNRLAGLLGVANSLPSMWQKRGRIPAEHCPAIERATGQAVRCEDLRPDVDWGVLRADAVGAPQGAEEVADAA